ncbi:MAG: response regulator [Inquilinus sp.]|nr:response regulator [Inquilinus sp.]
MGKRILIVDDDPLLVKLLQHKLSSNGYDTVIAHDGADALRSVSANKGRFDLIVLDAMMPEIDGFEVLRKLGQHQSTKKIPVVMLTARRKEQDVVAGLSLGARDYLVKPFMPDELLTRIGRILN